METTAAVLRSPDGAFSLEPLVLDEPGPGELLVRIVGTGLCHTDLLPRRPDGPFVFPLVVGHEGAGVVEAVGPGVTIPVGAHVVMSYDSCGACRNCLAGQSAYCELFLFQNLTGFRMDGTPGAADATGGPVAARWFGQSSLAGHCLATERNVVVVDDDLPLELLGPLGCGVQTGAGSILVALGVGAGDSLVVFGTGAVGLSAVMAARLTGAATIAAVDLQASRRELALELGATHAFDGADPDLGAQLAGLGGFDRAFDTTGVPAVIATAVAALRPTGVCGLVGVQSDDLVLGPLELASGKTVTGILEGGVVPQVFIPRLIDLWRQERFPFDRLVTTFALADINAAEAACTTGDAIKPVLLPALS